jgi:ACS family tartrate transporter-like MFS transporter
MTAAASGSSDVSGGAAVSASERRILNKVKRYLFLYIFLGQVFYQFDRSNIGFANLTMGHELGLNAEAFGFASGIFGLSAFLMQLPAGFAFDRLGPRRWMTGIMVAWGLTVLCQGFVTDGAQLAVLRFMLGVFEAGFLPGVYIIISIWFRGRHHGAAMATLMLGLASANIFGGPFSGWVLGTHFFGLSGWRNLFVIDGALTVVWALASLGILYDGPEKARWLKPDERAFMSRYLAEYQAEKKASGATEKASLWESLKNPEVVTLMLAFGFSGWIASTFTFFIPTLLKRAAAGVSVQYVGFLMMGPYIVYAIVAQFWGRHADRTERRWHSTLPLLVSVVGILLYPIAKTPLIAMAAVCLIQAGTAGFFVNFWPTANMVAGRNAIAKSTALINSGQQALSFLGPIYFGWALDKTKSTDLGLYTAIGVLVLNFALMQYFFIQYNARQKRLAAS